MALTGPSQAIATLVVFIISIISVILPFSVPLRPLSRIARLPIDLRTAPFLAVVILWATNCLGPNVIYDGIVGMAYNNLILFFFLSYIFITLDITGILQALAFWISTKATEPPHNLIFHAYGLIAGFAYLSNIISPVNISLLIEIGVGGCYIWSFIPPYILQSVGITSNHYRRDPRKKLFTGSKTHGLLDYFNSFDPIHFTVVSFVLLLVLGIIMSWKFILLSALAKSAFDLIWDYYWRCPHNKTLRDSLMDSTPIINGSADSNEVCGTNQISSTLMSSLRGLNADTTSLDARYSTFNNVQGNQINNFNLFVPLATSDPVASSETPSVTTTAIPLHTTTASSKSTVNHPNLIHLTKTNDRLREHFPTTFSALALFPFCLVPAVFSQSILIEALRYHGWIDAFSVWLGCPEDGPNQPTIWIVGILGVIAVQSCRRFSQVSDTDCTRNRHADYSDHSTILLR